MVNQDLGRVCVVPRGAYDPEVAYTRLDAVSYNGSCYMARKDCQGVTPAEGEYYMLMADGSVALTAAARADEAAESALDAAGKANDAATAAQAVVDSISPDVIQLKKDMAAILSGTKENARFHLGLYRDENGELCELEDE